MIIELAQRCFVPPSEGSLGAYNGKKEEKGELKKVFPGKDNLGFHKDEVLDERGFSTAGMVLALLITLSLIFSAAQVYQINSASATIQNVADAAVLAAQNEVAEFYVIARVSDAIILSLSITGVAAMGLGVVALCIPATASLADKLIKAGNNILDARDSFAEKAAESLNALQKMLPFLSAANAESILSANSGGTMNASYKGVALLLPFEGQEISVGPNDAAQEFTQGVEEDRERIKEIAQEAEEAAEKAKQEKERAFLHDCGNSPGYCMYERAQKLASLSATQNPLYHSVDTWDFSVALERAQAYYPLRAAQETPVDDSVESQADCILRKRFYDYAVSELAKGYVSESEEGAFDAYFPLLPKNTTEMKATELYTEVLYPIGQSDGGAFVMHAWAGCPRFSEQSFVGTGSISQMDGGGFETCSQCGLTVSSFGKIAAASSSIENGFEYHYRIVAEAAQAYEQACAEYRPYAEELKELTEELFEQAKEAFSEAFSYRLHVSPPGNVGAVALVVNVNSQAASKNFTSTFVVNDRTLGAQAAISASTLASDSSEEGYTLISSLLDGVKNDTDSLGVGLVDGVLDLWSSSLRVYAEGQKALGEGIEKTLDGIPLVSESGLGTWAAKSFREIVESLGFEPVELDSLKPILVNSSHVLMADDSSFSAGLLEIKQRYLALDGDGSGSLFSSALSQVEKQALESVEHFSDSFVIASIELFGDSGPSIPITISLPPVIVEAAKDLISAAIERLEGIESSITGVRRWE